MISTKKYTCLACQVSASNKINVISLRAVNGSTEAKIASGKSYQFEINTATEQYFDITPYLNTNDEGVATVTVTNVGDGLLSVNNLKVVGGGIMPLSDNEYDYDAPVVEEDVQEPETEAPMNLTSIIKMIPKLIKMFFEFIKTIILKLF